MRAPIKGWYWPVNSRKAHCYDADNRSLCGKWTVLFFAEDGLDPVTSPTSSDDCAACRRKVDKILAQEPS